jgi:hypothetical protein
MSIVGAQYDKAKLSEEEAQRLNDTPGLADLIAEFINQNRRENKFADEEEESNYEYPPEYTGPKPIEEQIMAIAKLFGLDSDQALEYAKNLPELATFVPEKTLPYVGWFAVPSLSALAKLFPDIKDQATQYCKAIELALGKIAKSRAFKNWREDQIVPAQLRMNANDVEKLVEIAKVQPGDILILALQLGRHHRGCSTRRARECFVVNEYGLGSFSGATIALTHPERFVRSEELDMDLPGDEFDDPVFAARFDHAPSLCFRDDELKFDTYYVDYADQDFGSASGFVPQQ